MTDDSLISIIEDIVGGSQEGSFASTITVS